MTFTPLPRKICAELEAISDRTGLVLELACADGRLGNLLQAFGVKVLGLDRNLPTIAPAVSVVGDALFPPVQSNSIDAVVAGNIVRHLLGADPQAAFLNRWYQLLKPGGVLILLEDQPTDHTPSARHYQDLQAFLAGLTGDWRCPLTPLDAFRSLPNVAALSQTWDFGVSNNQYPVDQDVVVRMLRGDGRSAPTGEAGRLLTAIAVDGLAYGDFWWACARKEGCP